MKLIGHFLIVSDPDCGNYELRVNISEGVSCDCIDFRVEVNAITEVTSCEHIACAFGYNVYEYDGDRCRFYQCTDDELLDLPTSTFYEANDIYVIRSKRTANTMM